MSYYVTKYALSKGIYKVEGEEIDHDMLRIIDDSSYTKYAHGEGREWHRDFESAKKRAEQMRAKKIASLEKQIKRVQEIEFAEEACQ